jgi:Carbohydrate-selective porin, OprB family
MFYFWYKSLVEQINNQNSLGMKITFSIALSIFSSIGLTAVSANELIQPIDLQQPSDLKSSDRAFRAFKSISDRYDCLSASSETSLDRISQIDSRSVGVASRAEKTLRERAKFAKNLNYCAEQIQDLAGVAPADLEILRQLQTEFATELTALKSKLDKLDTDISKLETQQFSTTTKLTGQAIFAINAGTFGGDRIIAPRGAIVSSNKPNATSLYRVSLDLNTSFSGTDLLKLRLVAVSTGSGDNAAGFLEPNFGSVLDFAVPGREQLSLGRLYYTFNPAKDLSVTVGPQMVAPDFVDQNRYANASFRDFSTAAITNNFILLPRPGGAGAAIDWKPNQSQFSARAVYVASSGAASLPENQQFFGGGAANDVRLFPAAGGGSTGGLFGDPYLGVVELEYAPTKSIAMRLQYSGGELFGSKFGVAGVNAEVAISPQVGLFARYGSGSYPNTTLGDIRPQYWSAGIAVQDLFTKNDLAGIGIAQPFVLRDVGNSTQTNFEAFYNIPVNKSLRITPIVQLITNPANQSSNGSIVTGTVRAVFSF